MVKISSCRSISKKLHTTNALTCISAAAYHTVGMDTTYHCSELCEKAVIIKRLLLNPAMASIQHLGMELRHKQKTSENELSWV